MRSIGGIDAVQSLLPDPVAAGFVLVSPLGNPWLILALLVGFYWFGDRRRGVRAMGVVGGGLALALALKTTLGLPRPPPSPPVPVESTPAWFRPAYERAVFEGGKGFPSGHAISATVGYGSLALAVERWTRRRRIALAAALATAVALSRVVLGVHYAGDVIAGLAVGVGYLAVVEAGLPRVRGEAVTNALALATAIAAVALVTSDASQEALVGAGAIVGTLAAWRWVDVPAEPWRPAPENAARALVGVAAFALLLGGTLAVDAPAPVVFLAAAVGMGVVVGLPGAFAPDAAGRSGGRPTRGEPEAAPEIDE